MKLFQIRLNKSTKIIKKIVFNFFLYYFGFLEHSIISLPEDEPSFILGYFNRFDIRQPYLKNYDLVIGMNLECH